MTMKSKKQKSWEDGVKSFNAKTYLNKRKEVAVKGGKLKGKKHKQGGIPIVAEGNEIIITYKSCQSYKFKFNFIRIDRIIWNLLILTLNLRGE